MKCFGCCFVCEKILDISISLDQQKCGYKATKLGESIFERQSETLTPEEELGSQSPVSYEEDFEDLRRNADLYVFNDQTAQGYRGVNINTQDNEESLGEAHMKDYIDVSSQESAAPVYFQSLSLERSI